MISMNTFISATHRVLLERQPSRAWLFPSAGQNARWSRGTLSLYPANRQNSCKAALLRFNGIDDSVPVTFIYGSKSWIDPGPAFDIQAQRNGYVDVQVHRSGRNISQNTNIIGCLKIIRGAGHHVYADAPDAFNEVVCSIVNGEHAHVDVENDSDKPTEQEHISAINPLQQVWTRISCASNLTELFTSMLHFTVLIVLDFSSISIVF